MASRSNVVKAFLDINLIQYSVEGIGDGVLVKGLLLEKIVVCDASFIAYSRLDLEREIWTLIQRVICTIRHSNSLGQEYSHVSASPSALPYWWRCSSRRSRPSAHQLADGGVPMITEYAPLASRTA